MIQIYAPTNKNYTNNGDSVLFPEACDAHAKLNGEWYLEIDHPLDEEKRWKHIVEESVISAPTFMGKGQLHRFDEVEKTDTGIMAKAYPIFFDSADELFLYSCHPTSKNGQEALDLMCAGSKYSGESNITTASTAYFENRNLMDCINGDSPSFLQRWGGEVLYNNYKVIINERVGGDYGAEVRYRKNMDGIKCNISMANTVTRIIPFAYNGRGITGKYVDSPNINKYAKMYIRTMKFENVKLAEDSSDEEDESVIICADQDELDATLTLLCNEQFEAGADLPNVTITVDMIDLASTEEYKDFKDLERVSLGDTVRCYHRDLDITTEARVIKIVWDCIRDCVKSVVLGDYEYDFISEMSSTLESLEKAANSTGNTIMAERIKGVLNAMNTQLKYQKTAAQKQDVRAILFEDLDPESELFGAMCLGSQGLQISNKRTADDRDWEWTTAWTAHGGYANTLILGILADKTGENYWNLETGELVLKGFATFKSLEEAGTTVINGANITTGTINADRINLEQLFAKKITASDMKITGTSEFLSEDKVFGTKIEIKNGKLKISSSVGECVNDAFGVTYYPAGTNANGRYTSIAGLGIVLRGDTDIEPEFPDDAQSITLYEADGYTPKGIINPFGIYGYDSDGVLYKLIDWNGISELYKLTVNGIPVTGDRLYNSDAVGNVIVRKNGDYYYLIPYEASKVYCGSTNYPWYRVYTDQIIVKSEKPAFVYIGSDGGGSTVNSAPNMYVAANGIVSRTTNTSSCTIKHDIKALGELEELKANNLYDIDVVQFKYNEEVGVDKNDARYGKDLPGFIIEDLDEKYPIAVDKPSDNVKEWAWNERYMIPAMLKLIQEQNERLKTLEGQTTVE